jgi:hypothetical protein
VTGRATAWAVLVGAVVVGAIAQGLTAAPGLGRMPIAAFVAVAIVSAVVLVAQVAATAWALHVLVTRRSARLSTVIAWSAVFALAALVVGVLYPLAGLAVAVLAACCLPAAADGRRNALTGLGVFVHAPVRAILGAIAVVALALVSFVVAFATGFLLTGVIGGIAMWLWFGAIGALAVWWFTHLRARIASRN